MLLLRWRRRTPGRWAALGNGNRSNAGSLKRRRAWELSTGRSSSSSCESSPSRTAYISLGSNVGSRALNLLEAVQGLARLGSVHQTSFLYETPPWGVSDQPAFLNAAVQLRTRLSPSELLYELKSLEAVMGRDIAGGDAELLGEMERRRAGRGGKGALPGAASEPSCPPARRWGPRLLDLDILLYGDSVVRLADTGMGREGAFPLQIPHPRLPEREFVLRPLADMAPTLVHPLLKRTIADLLTEVQERDRAAAGDVGTAPVEGRGGTAERVVVMRCRRVRARPEEGGEEKAGADPAPGPDIENDDDSLLWRVEGGRGFVMGILNTTPDSFSDGGQFQFQGQEEEEAWVERAADRALELEREGADIVDIGGESTRPGAEEVSVSEQIRRVVPVVAAIRRRSPSLLLSVDTRRAAVAEAAVRAGADVINDVSGGTFDPLLLPTAARLGCPVVLMHMRGTPLTMSRQTEYSNVVLDVGQELQQCSQRAIRQGVPRWMQFGDPGIGFAKTPQQSLTLLKHIDEVQDLSGGLPLLVGTSRKGFIASSSSPSPPSAPVVIPPLERDWGTAAAQCFTVGRGAVVHRVHAVKGVRQALDITAAIRAAPSPSGQGRAAVDDSRE